MARFRGATPATSIAVSGQASWAESYNGLASHLKGFTLVTLADLT